MLVFSRKKNDSILIDDTIVITIVDIRADKVRVGVQAPRDVHVQRAEFQPRPAPFDESANASRSIRSDRDDWKDSYDRLLDRLIDVEREKRALESILHGTPDATPAIVGRFEGVVRESDADRVVITCVTNDVTSEQTFLRSQFAEGKMPRVGDRVAVSIRASVGNDRSNGPETR